MPLILVIDDEIDFLKMLGVFLRKSGFDIRLLTDGNKAIEEIEESKPNLVITDILMPGTSGGEVYKKIRHRFGSHLPIIVCTGTSMRVKVDDDPLFAYIQKPVDFKNLLSIIESLLSTAEKMA